MYWHVNSGLDWYAYTLAQEIMGMKFDQLFEF